MKIIINILKKIHNDNSGQVLIYFLIIFSVLICFLALTVNVGNRIENKISMQNAADAFAIEGAMWFARSLNMISILNVSMAETLANIIFIKAIQKANNEGREILEDNISEASYLCSEGQSWACDWLDRLYKIGEPGINSIDDFYNNDLSDLIDDLWEIMNWLEEGEDQIISFNGNLPLIACVASSEGKKIATLNKAKNAYWLPKNAGLPVQKGKLIDFSDVLNKGGSGIKNFLSWDSVLEMKHNGVMVKKALKYLWLTYNESGPYSEGPDISPLVPPVNSKYNSNVYKVYKSLEQEFGMHNNGPIQLIDNWKDKLNFIVLVNSKNVEDKIKYTYHTNSSKYSFKYNGEFDETYAIAQVQVYNPKDENLFNQEWMVKLVPIYPEIVNIKSGINNSMPTQWLDKISLLQSIIVH